MAYSFPQLMTLKCRRHNVTLRTYKNSKNLPGVDQHRLPSVKWGYGTKVSSAGSPAQLFKCIPTFWPAWTSSNVADEHVASLGSHSTLYLMVIGNSRNSWRRPCSTITKDPPLPTDSFSATHTSKAGFIRPHSLSTLPTGRYPESSSSANIQS